MNAKMQKENGWKDGKSRMSRNAQKYSEKGGLKRSERFREKECVQTSEHNARTVKCKDPGEFTRCNNLDTIKKCRIKHAALLKYYTSK